MTRLGQDILFTDGTLAKKGMCFDLAVVACGVWKVPPAKRYRNRTEVVGWVTCKRCLVRMAELGIKKRRTA